MMSISFLRKLSIGYLLLPNVVFSWGWFRQPYASLLIAGYLVLMFREFKKQNSREGLNHRDIPFLISFALAWTVFSGITGLVAQTADFNAHNAKFFDLYLNKWPNYFPDIDRYSCYYFGYFLIPSLASKMAGTLLPSALFLWSAIGYFLAGSWVYHLLRKSKFLLFSFLWFKGIGHILFYAMKKSLFIVAPVYVPMIRAAFEQSQWVPNQFIATLIVTCIILSDCFDRRVPQESFLPLSLLLIWGIFPFISLVLIFCVICFKRYMIDGSLIELFSTNSLFNYWTSLVLIIPSLIYFFSSNGALTGFLWEFDDFYKISFFYAIGFLADWLLYLIIIKFVQKKYPWIDTWFMNAILILFMLVSFLRIGKNNDWFMRGQIPFFLVITIAILRHLSVSGYIFVRSSIKIKAAFGIVILAASIQLGFSCYLLRDNILVKRLFPTATTFAPIPYDRFQNVYQALKLLHPKEADAEQYLGKKDSFYEKHLARTP